VKKFKKAQVNGGSDNDSLKDSHKGLRCRGQTRIMVIKPFLLLGLAAEYRSRLWM